METINTDYNCKLEKFRLNCSRCTNRGIAPLTMFVFLFNRLDAAMERERLLALEKEKAKEDAKKRYVFSIIQYHSLCFPKNSFGGKSVFQTYGPK